MYTAAAALSASKYTAAPPLAQPESLTLHKPTNHSSLADFPLNRTEISFNLRSETHMLSNPHAARRLDNIESGFYISPELLDKLAIHLAKNFLALPRIKTPLILGIWGAEGQGESLRASMCHPAVSSHRLGSGARFQSGARSEQEHLLAIVCRPGCALVRGGFLPACFLMQAAAGHRSSASLGLSPPRQRALVRPLARCSTA